MIRMRCIQYFCRNISSRCTRLIWLWTGRNDGLYCDNVNEPLGSIKLRLFSLASQEDCTPRSWFITCKCCTRSGLVNSKSEVTRKGANVLYIHVPQQSTVQCDENFYGASTCMCILKAELTVRCSRDEERVEVAADTYYRNLRSSHCVMYWRIETSDKIVLLGLSHSLPCVFLFFFFFHFIDTNEGTR
jgi:hypothetical protein